MLEGAQQLRTVLQNQRAVGAGNLHENFGAFPLAVAADLRVHRDLVAQVEIAVSEGSVQQFADLLGSGDFVVYRHILRVSPDYLLALLRARFSISSRISRPRPVRFMMYCCPMAMKFPTV